MPTLQGTLRRSGRNAGKKIKSPRYKHDLFQDPPTVRTKKKKAAKKTVSEPKKSVAEVVDEEDVAPVHPSKNYTKIELYDKWKSSSKSSLTFKKEVQALQKESFKDKKELEKLYRENNKMKETIETLEIEVEDSKYMLEELKKKNPTKKKSDAKPISDSERIANMRSTFSNLASKKEYEHKTVLCELQLKYDELALNLKAKEDLVGRLEEEIRTLKKDQSNFNTLKVASLKSELQISSMKEKNFVR